MVRSFLSIRALTIAVALAAPLVGRLADRFSLRVVIVSSAFALAIMTVLAATSSGLGQLIAWRFAFVRTAIGPILSGLQNLPSVAWVPIGVLWFGITPATIYMVVLLGAVPSIAIGVVSGLDHVPPIYLRVGRGTSDSETGLLLVPLMVGIGVGSLVTGRIVSQASFCPAWSTTE